MILIIRYVYSNVYHPRVFGIDHNLPLGGGDLVNIRYFWEVINSLHVNCDDCENII